MKDLDEIVQLQELVEQAFKAVGNIGPSELRLMNREVRAALASFMVEAELIVAALALAREEEGREIDPTDGDYFAITGKTQIVAAYLPAGSALITEPDYEGNAEAAQEGPQEPMKRDDPEIMCPQTKAGVPCTRTLHNVGLHTPDGYPENGSWTDKESDE